MKRIKLRNNVISKVKNNNTQSKLNKEERAENVKNVYKITNNKRNNRQKYITNR